MLVAEELMHPGEIEDLAAFAGKSTETAQQMLGSRGANPVDQSRRVASADTARARAG